jgi:hypothetical protein
METVKAINKALADAVVLAPPQLEADQVCERGGGVVTNVSVGCNEKEIRGTISNLFVSLCEEFNEYIKTQLSRLPRLPHMYS